MGYFSKWIKVAGMLFVLGICTLPAGGSDCCTDGFHSLQQLISATDTVAIRIIRLQGLHPALRITCDGNLTEIIYTKTLGELTGLEFVEVWRERSPGTNFYDSVSPPISRDSETLFAAIDEDVALYSVKVNNFSVRASDFIGFASLVPPTLRFLNLGNSAPGSIYIRNGFQISIDLDFVAASSYDRDYFPLITVVITPSSVVCSNTRFLTPTSSPIPTPTSSPIPTPDPVNFTTADSSRNSKTILAAALSSVAGVCLILIVMSMTVTCVAFAARKRGGKEHCVIQSPGTELRVLSVSSPEVSKNKDKEISSKEGGSSDGDDSSMEYNPIYGNPIVAGYIHQHNSTSDEDKYCAIQFKQKEVCEQEQQQAINGDNNYYYTPQFPDHKPIYDSEGCCILAKACDYVNTADVQVQGKSSGHDLTTVAEIEHQYDKPNAGYKRAEHGVIVLNPNICYN